MSEEIKQIKQTLETWQHIIDFGYGTIEVQNETKIFKTILNIIEKQQKEIEKLKTDKKNASEYIREEMYVDENPTLDDDNTINELPISLSLCNEDLRKLLELLEE